MLWQRRAGSWCYTPECRRLPRHRGRSGAREARAAESVMKTTDIGSLAARWRLPLPRVRCGDARPLVAGRCGGAGADRASGARFRSRSRPRSSKTMPVQVEALGTVTPMASVAIKPRVDSEIIGRPFRRRRPRQEGRRAVRRSTAARIEAQIAPGRRRSRDATRRSSRRRARLPPLHRTRRQERDARSPISTTRNPGRRLPRRHQGGRGGDRKSAVCSSATATIRAPITGRISAAAVKVGNFVRSGRPDADRDHQPDRADLCDVFRCRSAVCPDIRQALAAGERDHRGDHSGADNERVGRESR